MKQSKPKTEKATATPKKSPRPKTNPFKWAYELLFHEDVYFRRIGGFLLWGVIILTISWAVGYFLVKNPILKGTLLVDKLFGIHGVDSAFGKWGLSRFGKSIHFLKWTWDTKNLFNVWGNVFLVTAKIFAHHLVIVFVFIFLLNHFRIKRFPLSYLFFLLFTVLLGLVVGTNSYVFPPQWGKQIGAVITFIRFGFWEWFAYGLLAVSTLNWGWFSSSSLIAGDWKKLRPFWPPRFATRDDREVFIYGLLFLLAASFAEARLIVHYNYHLIF